MVFPGVMFGCESWTLKKAECQRVDAFKLWCQTIPWTARRSNPSILKEINPEYSLEGLMMKLKLQHFGHLTQRANSLEKTLMLGKTEGRRRRGWQDEMDGWHHQCNEHELGQTLGDGEGQGNLVCCSPWGCEELDTTWRLNNNLTKLMQWDIENLNRSIATYENGSMDQNLTPLKILQSKIVYMHLLSNFHWLNHICFILYKLSQKSEQVTTHFMKSM